MTSEEDVPSWRSSSSGTFPRLVTEHLGEEETWGAVVSNEEDCFRIPFGGFLWRFSDIMTLNFVLVNWGLKVGWFELGGEVDLG